MRPRGSFSTYVPGVLLVVGLVTGLPGPAHAAAGEARPLSLEAAIDGALAHNVDALLARANEDDAAGQRVTARAAFLPHLSGQVSQQRRQTNLAAQGFDFGSDLGGGAGDALAATGIDLNFPTTVTYNVFDARAHLRQTLFDYSAWQTYKQAKVGERAARARSEVAEEQVAAQAELDYIALASANAEIEAAQADIDQAEALLKLARDQETVGVATGLDVTRARSRLAENRARLAQRRTEAARARIRLARTVGLPLGTPIRLTDALVFRPMPLGSVDGDIATAFGRRAELTMARLRIDQSSHALASAKGQRLPTVGVEAAYGESGNTPGENARPTYAVGATLNVPIFDGGAISGRVDSAASQLNQQRIRFRDTQDEVEADVRTSRETLTHLDAQVRAARSNETLAEQELARSQDRFANGVTDNVEVVEAQTSLAAARSRRINALAEFTRARINRAAALGRARQFSLNHPMRP
ncbi:TolC family protein [uncultured Salinisphaera sp.]|mgnify:CR=1 FL=1|uniref:TolC family protein n=1 Tax=uncultured Salinisphaera sp. TaxID=359372 RepID=UPI0032B1F9DA|tara:strand:- start:3791 stop:5203 length:1413 start_codon:yes stop_codon:yes gene_type:complete